MSMKNQQRGVTLIVALVMLVVLTLLVISAIRSSNTNLRIAGNMQMQGEAAAAAQQAIEQILSGNFTAPPTAITIQVDINNDGTPDYAAAVAQPSCTGSRAVANSALDMNNANDVPCFSSSTTSNTGMMFVSATSIATGQSWCFDQQWDVAASSTSSAGNGATAEIHQGAALRVPAGTTC